MANVSRAFSRVQSQLINGETGYETHQTFTKHKKDFEIKMNNKPVQTFELTRKTNKVQGHGLFNTKQSSFVYALWNVMGQNLGYACK